MKIFKELLPYLHQSARLYLFPLNKIKRRNIKNEIPLIVSFTTIPSRIHIVHLTVRSILLQKSRPKKIWLWVHENLKIHVPNELKKLEGEVFEIQYSKLDCPHLKLIESLKKEKHLPIVTIDDDQIYPRNLLSVLYESHLLKPKHIISCTSRLIKFDEEGNPLPYQQWPYEKTVNFEAEFLLPLGVFGVLYPPGCFNEKVTNIGLIQKLSPKADDLWFKALSMVEGTRASIVCKPVKEPIMVPGTQENSLKHHNISQDNNRIQWQKLMDYFKIKPDF